MSLTEQVVMALRDYGFEEIAAGPLALEFPEVYLQREQRGQLTGLEPDWRCEDRAKAFIGERNIVVATLLPYSLLSENRASPKDHVSRISIMAAEWDYHLVFKEKLTQALLPLSMTLGAIDLCLHVDNGPLPERHIALSLGLVTAGKSQMVLNPRYGSAFYIGLVLLKDENANVRTLKQGYSLDSNCLNCQQCQVHCPSGALKAQGGFDGTICISATTQYKGELSGEQMTQMGQHLYGCDHCQLSCPLNSPLYKTLRQESGMQPLKALQSNSLAPTELLYLSQKAFKKTYGHLGFAWRGVKTLKRNALINMANSGQSEYIQTIEEFIKRNDPAEDAVLIRTAHWALNQLKQRD